MKFYFNRRKIETICIVLSSFLIVFITFFCILGLADGIFNWDVLPKSLENFAVLIMASIGLIILACFLLNIMVNLSLISINMEKIYNKLNEKGEKENERKRDCTE